MNKRCVKYRDSYLDPNSKAYELYHSKDPKDRKELDKLIKLCDAKSIALENGDMERYHDLRNK
jgi:hypothetical protein